MSLLLNCVETLAGTIPSPPLRNSVAVRCSKLTPTSPRPAPATPSLLSRPASTVFVPSRCVVPG
eukprot:scaffold2263_cov391-Prasinococcus_capsulatus_cf.AAC.1